MVTAQPGGGSNCCSAFPCGSNLFSASGNKLSVTPWYVWVGQPHPNPMAAVSSHGDEATGPHVLKQTSQCCGLSSQDPPSTTTKSQPMSSHKRGDESRTERATQKCPIKMNTHSTKHTAPFPPPCTPPAQCLNPYHSQSTWPRWFPHGQSDP